MPQPRFRLVVEIPHPWLPLIDRCLGGQSRSGFVREVIRRSLWNRGVSGAERFHDERGRYDRLASGHMSPKRAKRERRRRKQAENARRWAQRTDRGRTLRVQRLREVPLAFQYAADGTINSPDLAQQGVSAGYVNTDGRFIPEARYDERQVFQGWVWAAEREPHRVWADRFLLFARRCLAIYPDISLPAHIRTAITAKAAVTAP